MKRSQLVGLAVLHFGATVVSFLLIVMAADLARRLEMIVSSGRLPTNLQIDTALFIAHHALVIFVLLALSTTVVPVALACRRHWQAPIFVIVAFIEIVVAILLFAFVVFSMLGALH